MAAWEKAGGETAVVTSAKEAEGVVRRGWRHFRSTLRWIRAISRYSNNPREMPDFVACG